MKKNIITLIFFLCTATEIQAQASLNIMTFNIRLNLVSDSLDAWPYRKDLVASEVLFHNVDILGVQEALYDQMKDLQQRLPHFKYLGVGRDDGKTKGEFSAIFYNSTRLRALDTKTFWLSLTPDIPGSKSWDAAITRIVTWVKFKDLKTQKIFFVFNTHFDHIGREARKNSAILLKEKVFALTAKKPAIIMGDFNSTEDDGPIQILLNKSTSKYFINAKNISSAPHYGPQGSFTAFGPKEISDKPIDYIFIKGKAKVLKHANISQTWQGRYASDHFAVFARIVL
ncbi:MAG: endonuclease/exonuclease/phosphatase family protein [Chitinophagaceae bacterium]|jgi:endonuclease/exonuclease/phosphatase family metal-dependent hydrolase|nr:endonuclease/exonuclease/phosphatase family protein [Chitinophagaceae bacterium]MBP6047636.1 endonuclease/exonuclease/phosphatase family protein [Ferruginibacter sp.]NMD29993.1 endonuclease/exonuclease/phosphatase family protein [Bacteroidota bacterium]MBK7087400.1 endonuclease/exonuclease/phosphatase family protein [Chitinophagaceae bacterium]MBK7346184.1 endonuclease/exonuclease/phosphatase family protein [Chitinophagaceae bacterium]